MDGVRERKFCECCEKSTYMYYFVDMHNVAEKHNNKHNYKNMCTDCVELDLKNRYKKQKRRKHFAQCY